MSAIHALLVLGTSMAGSRLGACLRVLPEHILVPLALPWGVVLITHTPTVLLASRDRTRQLCAATAQVLVVWTAGVGAAWVYNRSPPMGYAVSLHSAARILLVSSDPGVVVGHRVDTWLRWGGACILCAWAWQMGPPLPAIDLPGFPLGPGALSHLMAMLASDLLIPPLRALAERFCLAVMG